jgi:hypothetical protein
LSDDGRSKDIQAHMGRSVDRPVTAAPIIEPGSFEQTSVIGDQQLVQPPKAADVDPVEDLHWARAENLTA